MPHTHTISSFRITRASRLLAGVLLALMCGLGPLVSGCQPTQEPQRNVFEVAEKAYRRGDYTEALDQYKAFLAAAPDHQLAPLAKQRILNIDRELSNVMGRTKGPRPMYMRALSAEEIEDSPRGIVRTLPNR